MKKNNVFDVFSRGGDTWTNRLNLYFVNISRISLIGFLAAFFVFTFSFLAFTDAKTKEVFVKYNYARILTSMNWNKVIEINLNGDKEIKASAKLVVSELKNVYEDEAVKVAFISIPPLIVFLAVFVFLYRKIEDEGKKTVEDQFLRGQRFVTLEKLKELVSHEQKSIIKFGDVDVPQKLLFRNFMCVGAMGSGKSQMIMRVLDSLRSNAKKTVVYDVSGEFTEKYYRHGKDILLNPMDVRCARWTVLDDIVEKPDLTMIAKAFIPDNPEAGANKFFVDAAQNLLEDLLEIGKKNGYTMDTVYRMLTDISNDELVNILQANKTKSAADMAGGTNAIKSVKSEVTNSKALRYIDLFTSSKNDDFSIREWIDREDDSWLFITSRATMHETIKPFVNVFLTIALAQAMVKRSDDLKIAFILDELDSAGKLEALNVALTQARKFGIMTLIGAQSISQVTKIYGKETMQTFIGNLQNKLVLRVEEDESQEKLSNILGKTEQEEVKISSSHGVEASRDSNSISTERKDKNVVHASEIGTLPDMVGFLKIAGNYPVAKVEYDYIRRDSITDDFVARDDLVIKKKSEGISSNYSNETSSDDDWSEEQEVSKEKTDKTKTDDHEIW